MEQKELTIDEQIEKAEKKVVKNSKPYYEAVDKLKNIFLTRRIKPGRNGCLKQFTCSDPSDDTRYEPGQGF